ncbi:MAG: heat-inducible transcriptional repressor HrcA [Armatimonadota bacterium]
MDQRKRSILATVVREHVRTAEPVGSKAVLKCSSLNVSSATIRKEMWELERGGYLLQPHTSAGRVPSDRGYRFYVDRVVPEEGLSWHAHARLEGACVRLSEQPDDLLAEASRLLSELLHQPAVVLAPLGEEPSFRHIQASRVDSHHILLVYVTNAGSVVHRLLEVPHRLQPRQLAALSDLLQQTLKGAKISSVSRLCDADFAREVAALGVPPELLDLIERGTGDAGGEGTYVEGVIHILREPEFADRAEAAGILEALESPDVLWRVFRPSRAEGVTVTIGAENPMRRMHQCSVVTGAYRLGGGALGAVGVLGPTRMDYAEAIPVVAGLASRLSQILSDAPAL